MLSASFARFAVPIALGLVAVSASAGAAVAADPDQQALIDNALSAASPMIAATATVKDAQGHVLRQGTGAYTCFPSQKLANAPLCLEKSWEAWADARKGGKPLKVSTIGIAYMLAGDAAAGGTSNTDPQAKEPTAHNQWIVEGPHLMILVPDLASLDGLSDDPASGEPYVMWKGTPYAHIMAPIGARPIQRMATH